MSLAEARRRLRKLQTDHCELQKQNEALCQALDKLQMSGERYRKLYEFAPVGYLTLDSDGTIREANRTVAWLLGRSAGRLAGQKFTRFVAPRSRQILQQHQANVLGSDQPQTCELLLRRAKGSTFSARLDTVHAAPDRKSGGGCHCIVTDITDRKRAADALRESEARLQHANKELERHHAQLQAVVDHLTEGLIISDLEGRMLHWNPAAVQLHGFSSEEEWRRRLLEFPAILELKDFDGTALPIDQWPLSRILRGETLRDCRIHIRRRDRDWHRVFSYSGALSRDREGRPSLGVLTLTDMTQRTRAQAELRERSERLMFLSRMAGLLLAAPDPMSCLREILEGLSRLLDIEVCFHFAVTPDGTQLELAACHGVSRKVIKGSRKLEFGQAMCGAVAASGEPAVVQDVQHKTGKRTRLIRSLGITCYVCHPLATPDRLLGMLSFGSRRRTHIDEEAVAFLRTVCSQVAAALQRKQAEQALQQERTLLRTLIDHLPDHVYVKDTEHRFLTANAATAWVMGAASPDELIGRTDADYYPPDQAEEYRADEERMLQTGKAVIDKEEPHLDPSGNRLWVMTTKLPVRGSNGKTIGLVGVGRDVTERRRAMAALRESEERLRQSVQVARLGHFDHDHRTDELYCSTVMRRIWGWEAKEIVSLEKTIAGVHPEDRAAFVAAVRRAHDPAGDGSFVSEHRVLRPGGTLRWVSARSQTTFEGKGRNRRPVRTIGALVDITAAKETEAALAQLNLTLEQQVAERTHELRDSEERFRSIVDSAADGILMLDRHGRIESMNPSALNMFGYPARDIVGRDISLLLNVPGQSKGTDFLKRYGPSEAGNILGETRESSGRRRDGTVMALELTLTEFTRGGRRKLVAMVHDITERKRLERELLEVGERERQQVGHELHDDLGQILHGLQFLVTSLQARLEREGVAASSQLDRVIRSLDEALDATRSLARGLQPVAPVPEGLMNALSEHAARVRKLYGVICRFSCSRPVIVADPAVATHLFRIAQEAVNNAIKHSKCKRILVRLKAANGQLILTIRDDGHGRFPARRRRHGMGLHVMQFRAAAISGSLVVQRRPEGGTEVVCTVAPASNDTPGCKRPRPRRRIG